MTFAGLMRKRVLPAFFRQLDAVIGRLTVEQPELARQALQAAKRARAGGKR